MSFPTKDEMIEELRDMCEKRLTYANGLMDELRDQYSVRDKLHAMIARRGRSMAKKNKIIKELRARIEALEE